MKSRQIVARLIGLIKFSDFFFKTPKINVKGQFSILPNQGKHIFLKIVSSSIKYQRKPYEFSSLATCCDVHAYRSSHQLSNPFLPSVSQIVYQVYYVVRMSVIVVSNNNLVIKVLAYLISRISFPH